MTRYIAFQNNEGRYNVPSFFLSDNEDLLIVIHTPEIKTDGVFYFIAKKGDKTRTYCLRACKTVVIPADWLIAGKDEPLISSIELRNKTGELVIKKYEVEPLILNRCDVGTEYISAVQRIEKENAELRKLYNDLAQRVRSYETNGIELDFED